MNLDELEMPSERSPCVARTLGSRPVRASLHAAPPVTVCTSSMRAHTARLPADQILPSEVRRGERVVRLSNPDKPFWPEEGITKGDLLRYYRDIAPTLLPYVRDRPFTMKRYPDGWQGRPYFRRNVANYAPAWIKRVAVRVTSPRTPQESRMIEAPIVNDELALLWMVNT